MALNPIVAVVLAGGPPDELVAGRDLPNKTFLPIAGTALVARTIASLRSAPQVGRIVVVAPLAAHGAAALGGADEVRPDGPSIADSLRSGLIGLDPDAPALVTTADLPVLTPAAIAEFLGLALASGADVVYSCVERATHMAQFPDVPHTWAKLRDGTFCGGGCVLLRPRAFPALERFLGRLGAARKNPAALASIFGWDVVAKYGLGRLSIAEAERRASKLLGAPVAAAISTHADIAVNVDRPSDVALAERLLTSSV